ncbi:MAG: hypothetical protein KGL39_01895 [Patescibacteria group bacterium]|nr:hypothetical protein [Patescibacteria group bacterium]
MNKKIIIPILACALVIGAAGLIALHPNPQKLDAAAVESLAICLKKSGAVFYGASWCSHCENQKSEFGAYADELPYVDCPTDPHACLQLSINAYPTWVMPDGQRLVGEQSLSDLAKASGCRLQ